MVLKMKPTEIQKWNSFVIRRFRYTEDNPQHDMWQSHAKRLLEDPNYIIYDDCDGLASTVAELLKIKGAKKVWRCLASFDGSTGIDHMVALVEDNDGDRWVVGDTYSSVIAREHRYTGKIFNYNNIDDGITWKSHP